MVPLLVFVPVTVVARASGELGVDAFDSWAVAVRVGLASMLLITASAHFGSRRADLIRMVPPVLPRPELLVTVTGIAELVTAFGLLVEEAAPVAAAGLAVLLVVMFPANVHAARARVEIGGRPPTPLVPRALVQIVFVAASAAIAFGGGAS